MQNILIFKEMFKINISEIFPNSWSFFIFNLYMFLFVCQGILVTNSQESLSKYNYNTLFAVLITELVKLIICLVIYCSRYPCLSFYDQIIVHYKLLWLYFIPAFLYCLYNNLTYINLLNYDPATYFILLQLRVVVTGVLFQIIFSRTLTSVQWLSLILLTIGCMIKNMNFDSLNNHLEPTNVNLKSTLHNVTITKNDGMNFNFSAIFILVQVLCSCFAGVYSEFLLKNKGLHVDIFLQNIFMYFDSIICGILMLLFQWNTFFFTKESWEMIFQPKVLLVIMNNASVGIVTSFFLKYLNSILKTIASALELIFITIFSWIIFNISIKWNTIISIVIVLISIILYSRNPVQNLPSIKKLNNENV